MTDRQLTAAEFVIKKLLKQAYNPYIPHHHGLHGDCIGADADFNTVCISLNLKTWIRPCTLKDLRAYCDGEVIADPVKPMKRNQAIVTQSTVMVACPPNDKELKRSGTWATIRMARRAKKPLYILFPGGKIQIENLEVKNGIKRVSKISVNNG